MSPPDGLAPSGPSARLRIRPPVRPWRLVVGAGLVLGGAVSCWALMVDASERHDVLILRRSVPAGAAIGAEDLGVVALGSDDAIPSVAADVFDDIVGRYARYQLAAGALLVDDNVQAGPLVTPGRALVSVVVESGDIPSQVGVDDEVALILVADRSCVSAAVVSVVSATVMSMSGHRDASAGSGRSTVAVSAEIDDAEVAAVATAAQVVIARPNSPAVAAAVAASTPEHGGECVAPGVEDGPAGGRDADDANEQQPVPTGVTPMDPSDVLVDPSS